MSAATAAIAEQTHIAVPIPARGSVETVIARWSSSGPAMNAATPRSNSTSANTRWIWAERSENPATNRAGETEEPTPRPTSAEPARTIASPPRPRR